MQLSLVLSKEARSAPDGGDFFLVEQKGTYKARVAQTDGGGGRI